MTYCHRSSINIIYKIISSYSIIEMKIEKYLETSEVTQNIYPLVPHAGSHIYAEEAMLTPPRIISLLLGHPEARHRTLIL